MLCTAGFKSLVKILVIRTQRVKSYGLVFQTDRAHDLGFGFRESCIVKGTDFLHFV